MQITDRVGAAILLDILIDTCLLFDLWRFGGAETTPLGHLVFWLLTDDRTGSGLRDVSRCLSEAVLNTEASG